MEYYYTYTIFFEDGCYYHGSRTSKVPPEKDTTYVGSPKTNKEKWNISSYKKVINETFSSYEKMMKAELELIGNNHKKDHKCLNAHNTIDFGCYGSMWYHRYENDKLVERLFKVEPDSSWSLGRPSVIQTNKNEDKKTKTSNTHKNMKKTPEHRESLRKSAKKRSEKQKGVNNVMSRPEVKAKHLEILKTEEYRKSVSEGVKNSDRWTEDKKNEHKERMKKSLLENNPSSKKVILKEKEYVSIQDAMRQTGMTRKQVKEQGIFNA